MDTQILKAMMTFKSYKCITLKATEMYKWANCVVRESFVNKNFVKKLLESNTTQLDMLPMLFNIYVYVYIHIYIFYLSSLTRLCYKM